MKRNIHTAAHVCFYRGEVLRVWECHVGPEQNEDVEIPWWTYGARGMQLWFPKTLAEPLLAPDANPVHYATDPELEFDREVYPIGVSLSEVSIIGASFPAMCIHLTRELSYTRIRSHSAAQRDSWIHLLQKGV